MIISLKIELVAMLLKVWNIILVAFRCCPTATTALIFNPLQLSTKTVDHNAL